MRRITTTLLAGALIALAPLAKADEGMWLMHLLGQQGIDVMQQKGCKLTAEQIYSLNQPSIKDAIIIFGNGCTGEIVSDKGLILTNHHCGYSAIQQHSTTEHDYLADGFWAMQMQDEIPTPGLTATFLVRIEDVTSKLLAAVTDQMDEKARLEAMDAEGQKLAKAASDGTHYRASVRSFFGGNQYLMLVYEIFTDVRMVGAPPSSIGKFGADTDNWMWPRHTGDFSVFRVYADKDNKPADYATSNVPYKPRHFLPVSTAGFKNGDFTMIMGYPGSTQRYMTSSEVEQTINIGNADRILIRGIRQEILLEDMLADQSIKIKYSSKYASSSNYWKNSIGMNQALKRLRVVERKRENEANFTKWVNATPERRAKYGQALPTIEHVVSSRAELQHAMSFYNEALLRGTELIGLAIRFEALEKLLADGDPKATSERAEGLKGYARAFYKDYSMPTDQKVAKAMYRLFCEHVDKKFQPEGFVPADQISTHIDNMYGKSMFADSSKLMAFLDKPSADQLKADPAFADAKLVMGKYRELRTALEPMAYDMMRGTRLFIAGTLEMNQGKPMYPDANFTMRLTYGEVKDYYPKDAVHYDYITYLEGVMEKEDPDNWEFVVPAKLKELYLNKDFGPYALNGKMPVAFLSTNDITGGNSGSPIMNARGELIGLAFDGNWEAMSGDIVFENNLQRCINVDIRYVLFIIDKYAGCKRLIDEMTLVAEQPAATKATPNGKQRKRK
ncbi:MAG: S46 family peptidase [Bacteroidales bacterium]|nr:S46 family peptidase [Bacteroidales bacterium]